MPISIPAISKPRVAVRDLKSLGFTLVELMVVLVILGLASAAVVMTIPDPGGGVRAASPVGYAVSTAGSGKGVCRTASPAVEGGSDGSGRRSEEHTSELQSLMRTSYA